MPAPRQPSIGRVRLGRVPRVVLCVTDAAGGRLAPGVRPDLLEARIDLFGDTSAKHVRAILGRLRRHARAPIIATIRTCTEGGRWAGSETDRESLFAELLPAVHAVDVELSAGRVAARIAAAARARRRTVIVSCHDFAQTPSEGVLAGRIRAARRLGADVVKIAALARTGEDVARLLRVLITHPTVPLVIVSMGPLGRLSRVFFPAAGSLLTYAFLDGEAATGPGQLTLEDLQAELRRYYPAYRTGPAHRGGPRAV
jgi:3-dehydroquinate dehydratase-1